MNGDALRSSLKYVYYLTNVTKMTRPCYITGSAVARVSEAPPEISRGAPHTLLAYYYELQ